MSGDEVGAAREDIGKRAEEAKVALDRLTEAIKGLATGALTGPELAEIAHEFEPALGEMQSAVAVMDLLLDAFERSSPLKHEHEQGVDVSYRMTAKVQRWPVRVYSTAPVRSRLTYGPPEIIVPESPGEGGGRDRKAMIGEGGGRDRMVAPRETQGEGGGRDR
jgi:hypothetical protein